MAEPTIESIRPRTRRLGRTIVHLSECGSTMDEARRRVAANVDEGLVVVADRQTQGRGRNQRTWFSPEGSLLATLYAKPNVTPATLPYVSLAAALALAESIQRLTQAPALIKWPNDVWIEGKKTAGILIETRFVGDRLEWALIGIGVNVDVRLESFPADVRLVATSLSTWMGKHVCAPALLKVWLERFENRVLQIEAGGTEAIRRDAEARLVGIGKQVRAEGAKGPVTGTLKGLGPNAELVVATSTGDQLLREGDASFVRPTDAA